ncbi:hypothetical protein EAH_00012630 [Eimeria acervulina]|uniref:Uncharacterized protein n=1 Tax=Eimeria acervulina TaxID=5801 RepID=U6GZM1_EIMAC|nr:hypothetical protein EAH_00012630 [Eimeria acervulina]CDI83979.1 hypothetical protein EAH_00012630 [Eimeria acervulina]
MAWDTPSAAAQPGAAAAAAVAAAGDSSAGEEIVLTLTPDQIKAAINAGTGDAPLPEGSGQVAGAEGAGEAGGEAAGGAAGEAEGEGAANTGGAGEAAEGELEKQPVEGSDVAAAGSVGGSAAAKTRRRNLLFGAIIGGLFALIVAIMGGMHLSKVRGPEGAQQVTPPGQPETQQQPEPQQRLTPPAS